MDKYDALFIRAVKSSNPEFRLRRLYQKFYCAKYKSFHMAQILVSIVERYNMTTPTKLIESLNPDQNWKFPVSDYWDKISLILQEQIWCTPINRIEGYPRSAYYRNRDRRMVK